MTMRRCTAKIYKKGIAQEIAGTFHCWSTDYEQFEDGIGQYPVAIVELDDGSVAIPSATSVKFINPSAHPTASDPSNPGSARPGAVSGLC